MPSASNELWSGLRANDAVLIRVALQAGADPEGRDGDLTPLMFAAARGQVEAMRSLLEHGAHINVLDDVIGTTALHLAAQGGSIEAARLLVEHGAYLNLQAPSLGFTPLMNAVWHRHAELVAYFLGLDDINVEIESTLGLKARDVIDFFVTGLSTPQEYLPQHKPEAERFHKLFDGYFERRNHRVAHQPLMAIVVNSDKQLSASEQIAAVQAAISTGADVNAVSPVMTSGHDAHTPILAAALFGLTEVVQLLLEAGADPTIGCGYLKANPAHKAAALGTRTCCAH